MEEIKQDNKLRKRVREDAEDNSVNSDANSPESKLARVHSNNSDEVDSSGSKQSDSDNSGMNSPEAKRIQDDLLDILDDSDPDPAIQGLDSVMKSFEEEILVTGPAQTTVTSDSGESRPELGYLLEASDDELGLPPSFSSENEQKVEAFDLKTNESGPVNFDDFAVGFDDEILSYDPYRFGIGGESDGGNGCNDYITLGGGLFESCEPGDISEYTWRPESLSAS